jgi:hypothetical protein
MYSAKQIEAALNHPPESECFGIYVGYQQIGFTRGYTKIGRTINVRALQRGRNQGGADWWFAAFWPLSSKAQTHEVESIISKELKKYKQVGPQGQRELYSISPELAIELITELLDEPLRIQHEQV